MAKDTPIFSGRRPLGRSEPRRRCHSREIALRTAQDRGSAAKPRHPSRFLRPADRRSWSHAGAVSIASVGMTALGRSDPFATPSGNDRYLREADGRSRRRADVADRGPQAPDVCRWLERHPRWTFHFRPTSTFRPRWLLDFSGAGDPCGPPSRQIRLLSRSVAHAVRTHLMLTSLRIDLVHDLRQVVGGWRLERRIGDVSLQLFQRHFLADGRSPANPSRNSQMFLGRTGWAELAPGSPNLASRSPPEERRPAHLYACRFFLCAYRACVKVRLHQYPHLPKANPRARSFFQPDAASPPVAHLPSTPASNPSLSC